MSKSSVSRCFGALSAKQIHAWLSRPISTPMIVVMIDGIHFRSRVVLEVLRLDAQGRKHVLGIREGSAEMAQVVRSLLSDLFDRGLATDTTRLWVVDGGDALRRAIVELFSDSVLIQRC